MTKEERNEYNAKRFLCGRQAFKLGLPQLHKDKWYVAGWRCAKKEEKLSQQCVKEAIAKAEGKA